MYDLLQEKGSGHIRIFAGGGGTILPEEIKELQTMVFAVFTIQMMVELWVCKA